jgi:hypothetical protein
MSETTETMEARLTMRANDLLLLVQDDLREMDAEERDRKLAEWLNAFRETLRDAYTQGVLDTMGKEGELPIQSAPTPNEPEINIKIVPFGTVIISSREPSAQPIQKATKQERGNEYEVPKETVQRVSEIPYGRGGGNAPGAAFPGGGGAKLRPR